MSHQAYAAHPQQQVRGTLSPGQTLVVNKYTVRVERYLSQGGFAHVYVVRTAEAVNNTTQHVLKRIAVADQAMLAEVKREVDIMRILRGHPNVVNLIDASWNSLPNGTYEVLILMEFCSGGGIIDMMNRRLRERLTEAEILQIFVDVCEAVAAMHNLKPPLLHRDLKVENILQSSLTLYKLCDFGSSLPVAAKPPSSTQEIRSLEADLNRHTTLQYRAPEMVDVYLRRPVDEKSDVWALGVLLYKLCYYTTPFEEHGPLAILNVQYRIPPYPVYSTQMNSIIASMLRELGAQRPSVFEILNTVHRMRGSKSPYRYNVPPQASLRPQLQPPPQSGLEDIVAFRTSPAPNPNANAAIQARQTVLNAIAPMRRGRPTAQSISNPSSLMPHDEKEMDIRKFEEQWKVVKSEASESVDDAWDIEAREAKDKQKGKTILSEGFDGFGDSFVESRSRPTLAPSPTPVVASPPHPSAAASTSTSKINSSGKLDVKDAFGDLGISRSREPSPTLAEAGRQSKFGADGLVRPPSLNAVSRTPVPPSMAAPLSPRIPASRTGLATYRSPTSLTVEERFPSLDDLDKGWSPPTSQIPPSYATSQPDLANKPAASTQQPVRTAQASLQPSDSDPKVPRESRSQQVTGTAMRNNQAERAAVSQSSSSRQPNPLDGIDKRQMPIGSSPTKYRPSRPALSRKHRSSMSIKYTEPRSPQQDWLTGNEPVATSPVEVLRSPVRRRTSGLFTVPKQAVAEGSPGDIDHNAAPLYKHDLKPALDTTSRPGGVFSKSPPKQVQSSANVAPKRQDSSSDDAEGPEDVNDRVVTKDMRRKKAKGRQSSVHDLVDLYGGSGRTSLERDRTGPPSPVMERKGRRTSGILVDLSVPVSVQSQPTLLSPATIIPESRAELASRRSASSPQGERLSPPASPPDLQAQNSRPASRTSPVVPAAERPEKPRPQSMFMFPPPKQLDTGLDTGPTGVARPRHSPRRGSISDMVDLYENLGGGSRPNPPQAATKPAVKKLNKTPSPIASRFPAVSPTGTSFSVNQVTNLFTDLPKLKPTPRRSPTTDSYSDGISPGHSSKIDSRNEFYPRVRRRSVSPAKKAPALAKATSANTAALPIKPAKPPSLALRMPSAPSVSGQRTPITETPISSPSPERPYQGVGRLIDQWQKKTEEADAARHPGPKPSGRPLGPRAVGRAR